MKRNTKIALVMMALSAMAMGSTSAFAHGGHGMWQQNAAPLTSEQQTAWQKIHNDFYAQSSALQQQLVTKRYEYNALLAANPPDSSKINAVATSLGLGLGVSYDPEIFKILPASIYVLVENPICAGGLTAILLNIILPGGYRQENVLPGITSAEEMD